MSACWPTDAETAVWHYRHGQCDPCTATGITLEWCDVHDDLCHIGGPCKVCGGTGYNNLDRDPGDEQP